MSYDRLRSSITQRRNWTWPLGTLALDRMFERILLIKRKQWPRYMIVWMTQLSLSLALDRPSVLFLFGGEDNYFEMSEQPPNDLLKQERSMKTTQHFTVL